MEQPPPPHIILQRLDNLRKWQDEQERILLEKQKQQFKQEQLSRRNMEQKKFFERFGLSISDSSLMISDVEPVTPAESLAHNVISRDESSLSSKVDSGSTFASPKICPQDYDEPLINISRTDVGPTESKGTKKTYLKKGEGITNRFKLNPDELRLDKLPKYKFANAHKESKFMPSSAKFKAKRKNVARKAASGDLILGPLSDMKLISKSTHNPIEDPDVNKDESGFNYDDISDSFPQQLKIDSENGQEQNTELGDTSYSNQQLIEPTMTWAGVLNSEVIQPISVSALRKSNTSLQNTPTREKIRQQQREIDDMSISELLEQAAQHEVPTDSVAHQPEIVQPDDPIANPNIIQRHVIAPLPIEIKDKITVDDKSESDEDPVDKTHKGHVQFKDNIELNEYYECSDSEEYLSTDIDDTDVDKTSTPNTGFADFRSKLFRREEPNIPEEQVANVDNEDDTQRHQFLLEKTELLKSKLAELEYEIEIVRQRNCDLTKMKQALELDEVKLQEERVEMENRQTDERIKLEVYLHDERFKLAEERSLLEKRAKELRAPNRKEREEVVKLKEQVIHLQKEITSKEQKHVAAQARLRAQIRNMEKDFKEVSFEVDNLKKENKKLESENMKLRRQSNNKMLSEINRNIAKLAPLANTNSEKSKYPVSGLIKQRTRSVPNIVKQDDRSSINITSEPESDTASEAEDQLTSPTINNRSQVRVASSKPVSTATSKVTHTQQSPSANSKREIQNEDGSRDIFYHNGNIKKISPDSMIIRMLYFNKDIEDTNIIEGTVKYYYAETNTWHTSYLDGLEILEYPNGRIEHRHKDGTSEVHFPDGSIRTANPLSTDVAEEWKYPDGMIAVYKRNGDKELSMPNGQREVHTVNHKRREYPDGTVKLLYPDGSQETRYSNGRIRLKDSAGNLVMDSENLLKLN